MIIKKVYSHQYLVFQRDIVVIARGRRAIDGQDHFERWLKQQLTSSYKCFFHEAHLLTASGSIIKLPFPGALSVFCISTRCLKKVREKSRMNPVFKKKENNTTIV